MRSLGKYWGERWPRLGKQQEMWWWWGTGEGSARLRAETGWECMLLLHPQGVPVPLLPKQDPETASSKAPVSGGPFLSAVADTAGCQPDIHLLLLPSYS